MSQATESKYLHFVPWTTPQDLHDALLETLAKELPLGSQDDSVGFEVSLGDTVSNGYVYFNVGSATQAGSAAKVEQWQILTPVRGDSFGVTELNRLLQRRFRANTRASAVLPEYQRRIPRPLGAEEIVYGDKVMQTV
ncbi:MAG: hypothetical protein M1118_10460 [Chloroflexi bacterium]|nr:hypothetical protein [Chloroflexota bacterium]